MTEQRETEAIEHCLKYGPSLAMGSCPPVEHLTAENYPGKWTSPDGQGPELIPVEMGERPGLNFSTEGGVAA